VFTPPLNRLGESPISESNITEIGIRFKIAIVGSGPSGLSAAARAAELGISHVLLESEAAPANTTRKFQKGKHVMAEPSHLALRSTLAFSAGTRESVIDQWDDDIRNKKINLKLNAQVVAIHGEQGHFKIELASGESIHSEFIVIAVGLQGNIRKLPQGSSHALVQYQLDDPDEYINETIVIIGGGDAGVENALALKQKNHVILINKQEDFEKCCDENNGNIISAISKKEIQCRLDTTVSTIQATEGESFPLTVVANTPQGIEIIACNRVIARLGAEPPRDLLKRFGIQFQNNDEAALPLLKSSAESSISGMYVIGALAGYPLIKQAINQGYDVVERIMGRPIESLDDIALKEKLKQCFNLEPFETTEAGISHVKDLIPHFASLNTQLLSELLLKSNIIDTLPSDIVFERNDYSTSFFSVVEGEVGVYVDEDDIANAILGAGHFFGEMGLISGRRRSATIISQSRCKLLETPRRTMLKLLDASKDLSRILDEASLKRAIDSYLGLALSEPELDALASHAKLCHFKAGEILFKEGDKADGLYLIRRGSVTVSRIISGRDYTLSYVAAGNYVGEMALLSGKPRLATVRAAVKTEAILLETEHVSSLIERNQYLRSRLDDRYMVNSQNLEIQQSTSESSGHDSNKANNLISFLTEQGIGEATDVLLIDYSKCIRCDNCERTCADTHGGTSRLNRDAGPTYANIHVPTSCRHCEHPHCMKDCPPDAIRRSVNGEVYITDQCIGCGNCVKNCPYDVIQLASSQTTSRDKSLAGFLLGLSTGNWKTGHSDIADTPKLAVKCDMCKSLRDGPVCVRSCPTGAALRVSPEDFLNLAHQLGAEAINQ
jgi:CRP-like cAMP-binding protein/Fe-S-cluster-containing hydrogenase component 2/thioredoxin reductase